MGTPCDIWEYEFGLGIFEKRQLWFLFHDYWATKDQIGDDCIGFDTSLPARYAKGFETMIHIYAPAPIQERRKFIKCRKCKCRRLHNVKFYEWYGPLITCLKCNLKTNCA